MTYRLLVLTIYCVILASCKPLVSPDSKNTRSERHSGNASKIEGGGTQTAPELGTYLAGDGARISNCNIRLTGTCPRAINLSNSTFTDHYGMEQVNAGAIKANCFQRGADFFHWCNNPDLVSTAIWEITGEEHTTQAEDSAGNCEIKITGTCPNRPQMADISYLDGYTASNGRTEDICHKRPQQIFNWCQKTSGAVTAEWSTTENIATYPATLYSESDMNVVVLAGQSNACGGGSRLVDFTPDAVDSEIFFSFKLLGNIAQYSPDQPENWTESSDLERLHSVGDGRFGSEITFARQFYNSTNKTPLTIVKVCAGSSKILAHWWGATGLLENHLKPKLNKTMELLRDKGFSPKVAAFLWIQGESDATSLSPDIYASAFHSLLNTMRVTYKNNTMPFVLARTYGGDMIPSNNLNLQSIRSNQVQVANCSRYGGWVYTDDVKLTDQIHWTFPAHRWVGKRFARTLLTLHSHSIGDEAPLASPCIKTFKDKWEISLQQWQDELAQADEAMRDHVRNTVKVSCSQRYHYYKWYLDLDPKLCEF